MSSIQNAIFVLLINKSKDAANTAELREET